jgi:hypothetical protein
LILPLDCWLARIWHCGFDVKGATGFKPSKLGRAKTALVGKKTTYACPTAALQSQNSTSAAIFEVRQVVGYKSYYKELKARACSAVLQPMFEDRARFSAQGAALSSFVSTKA